VGDIHKIGAEVITQRGLSRSARALLATFSGLFGLIMVLTAPDSNKAVYFYLSGGFCGLICIACITSSRIRQLAGSCIGTVLFLLSFWYTITELLAHHIGSNGPGAPSLLQSLAFFVAFGIPGASYAYKARFGFRREAG